MVTCGFVIICRAEAEEEMSDSSVFLNFYITSFPAKRSRKRMTQLCSKQELRVQSLQQGPAGAIPFNESLTKKFSINHRLRKTTKLQCRSESIATHGEGLPVMMVSLDGSRPVEPPACSAGMLRASSRQQHPGQCQQLASVVRGWCDALHSDAISLSCIVISPCIMQR